MDFKSKLLNDAVEQMSSLPGIGKRSALRLVLHLLDQSEKEVKDFTQAFLSLKEHKLSLYGPSRCTQVQTVHNGHRNRMSKDAQVTRSPPKTEPVTKPPRWARLSMPLPLASLIGNFVKEN